MDLKTLKWTNRHIFCMVSQKSTDKQTFYIDLLIAQVNNNWKVWSIENFFIIHFNKRQRRVWMFVDFYMYIIQCTTFANFDKQMCRWKQILYTL